MSDKILTQDEISALLQTVGNESEKEESSEASGSKLSQAAARRMKAGLSPGHLFPLVKAPTLTKEVESSLILIHDTFAHKGSSTLSTMLRTQVAFDPEDMEQILYSEFIEMLPEPSSLWYLQLNPFDLHIALCLEPSLVHAIIAVMLGGGSQSAVPERPNVTDLEQSVLETVVRVFCRELQHAWNRLLQVDIAIDNRETRPRLLQIYPPREGMVVAPMKMKVGSTEGGIYWGIPSSLLKILNAALQQQNQMESRQKLVLFVKQLKERVLEVPTNLEVNVEETPVSTTDLLELREGSVIRLEHRISDPVVVRVNGKDKFAGRVVASNGRKAVKIDRQIGRFVSDQQSL
jgi:flagellar motor switch protein FliM